MIDKLQVWLRAEGSGWYRRKVNNIKIMSKTDEFRVTLGEYPNKAYYGYGKTLDDAIGSALEKADLDVI